MSEKDNDIMKRYIYQVVCRLKREQRKEIGMELETLIVDMAEEENLSIREVLVKLGDPKEFAERYREDKRYVIGPDYYDNYIWVIKIVLAAVLIAAVVSGVIKGIMDGSGIVDIFIVMILNIIMDGMISAVTSFGSVTLIFAVLECLKVNVDLKNEKSGQSETLAWSPEMLTPVPDQKARISRGESVVGITITIILAGLLLFAPQLFGAYIFEEKEWVTTIPIFNLSQWNVVLPVLLFTLFAGLTDEIIRLVKGCYCKVVMISSIVFGLIQIVLSFILLKILPFWNPDFMIKVSEQYPTKVQSKWDIVSYWENDFFSNVILVFVCFIIFIEIGVTIYKTLKYSSKESPF